MIILPVGETVDDRDRLMVEAARDMALKERKSPAPQKPCDLGFFIEPLERSDWMTTVLGEPGLACALPATAVAAPHGFAKSDLAISPRSQP